MSIPVSQSHPHLINYWHPSNNKSLANYVATSQIKGLWRCPRNPHHTFFKSINARVQGAVCRQCHARGRGRKKRSNGECQIDDWLTTHGIVFRTEYTLPQLPYKRFDFYLVWQNRHILIEFDGAQHFHQVRKFQKTKKKLQEQRASDRYKHQTATQLGYIIFRFDYTCLPYIEQHLTAAFAQGGHYFSTPQMYTHLVV